MTKGEVIAASNGTAHLAENPSIYDSGLVALLDGTYKSGDFSFTVKFLFDRNKKLARVMLELEEMVKCTSLQRTMSDIYGPPKTTTEPGGITKWRWWDEKNGNFVLLSDSPKVWCNIHYNPYVQPNQDGGL